LENAPPVILNLWDKKWMLQSDVFLGRAVIDLKNASTNPILNNTLPSDLPLEALTVPKPQWHPIRQSNDES
jgi:hypothetical protein